MNIFTPKQGAFKKAFLHLDGDSFFAACEVALNPKLKGRPVVTGLERGIASAMTYEAKARGITRGMRLFEMRKICPEVVIIPSDYETYSIFSQRMYNIVRRYAPDVEEYSIDECFADITSVVERIYRKGGGIKEITALGRSIKDDLKKELGLTFSLGIAPTKVLAKIGSKHNKPDGLTVIEPDKIDEYLVKVPIDSIWGIGPSTSVYLSKKGIRTAYDFTQKSKEWVEECVNKPHVEIWHELCGRQVYEINDMDTEAYKSISRTRTFTPATRDRSFIFAELSKNIEHACARLRRYGLMASRASYYIKTQDFRYYGTEVMFGRHVNTPECIVEEVQKTFNVLFTAGTLYRASGVTLMGLEERGEVQKDLFGSSEKGNRMADVYKAVDRIAHMYGKRSVFLASSLLAMAREDDDDLSQNKSSILYKNNRRLAIPFMGEVR